MISARIKKICTNVIVLIVFDDFFMNPKIDLLWSLHNYILIMLPSLSKGFFAVVKLSCCRYKT